MITFSGKSLFVDGKALELEHPVADAFELGNRIIVLFDPEAPRNGSGTFQNLFALRANGNRDWIAELPTNESSDVYVGVASKTPLLANSWSCYMCEIEPTTGRIKARVFTK